MHTMKLIRSAQVRGNRQKLKPIPLINGWYYNSHSLEVKDNVGTTA